MIEFFNIRTLLLVFGGTLLVSAVSMACYTLNRKIYGNFRLWTLGMGSLSLGFLLISFRDLIPDLFSIVLANILVFSAIFLTYMGFTHLSARPVKTGKHLVFAGLLSLVVVPCFTYWVPSVDARIVISSFYALIYLGLIFRVFIFQTPAVRFRDNILLVISLILLFVLFFARGTFYLVSGSTFDSFMESAPFHEMVLFSLILLQFAFVMGLMQLNSQQLEHDLLEKERRLKKNQKQYRQLVEESLQGLVIARDRPARLVFVSSPMARISGYTPSELKNFTPEQLKGILHPEDRALFFSNFKNRLAGMDVSPVQQYRIRHKTKGYRWVETYTALIDFDGQPAVHSHFLDITQKKEAEDINVAMFKILGAVTTARDLNDLFQTIHESLFPIIDVTNFFIALKDPQTHTLYFPYHVDTADDDFLPIEFDSAKNNSLTGLVFAKKEAVLLNREELRKREANNQTWGPLAVIWMGVPLVVKDKVLGVVAVQSYTDPDLYTRKDLEVLSAVSHQMALAIERKQAQEALVESEKRYRYLFSHAPAGICEVDFEKNRFFRVNDVICKFSGYTQAEFMDMKPLDLLTKKSRDRFKERIANLAAGEPETKDIEYDLISKQGKQLTVAVTLDFAHDDKKLSHTLVVIHDISWRQKIEKEKIKAQKLLGEQQKLALIGQVAGKMAHDFNNILGVIMGNVELMLMDHDDPDLQKMLKRILAHTEKGQYLTRNLIAFAKNQAPRQKYFSLNQKIDLALALMKKDLEGIHIQRSYDSDLPDVLADPGMIEHSLINLLQNAVHALSKTETPKIILDTCVREANICLEIKDNGCGIPESHIHDIFTPSFTLKGGKDVIGAYAPGIKGTGYGMANIQKYVHQHQGTIEVTSVLDQGTCVRICFPVIEKQLTAEEKEKIAGTAIRTGRYILVVEDEPDISGAQHRVLSQAPCHHQVDVAADAATAMDLFDQNRYDLISLDYMLAGSKTGMDVYRHIRRINSSVPVLFVSGNIEFIEAIKPLMEKDRFVAHLSKPCRMGAYVEHVNQMLAG
ncbi:PAS domain S-box protein [Desulfotignum phosphitoxidans]|uniref:histidine kinase n=1 Tax=Desulfotignum phosphitoxidans DSM 13687 TaxID=1286635 RepID=S0G1R4_9BACT|nr:PAS domain S-box protein [Desulfotignum phosphitoxidans]EMS79419.1 multi-sensor hybrid histidine kinase [Desulfotignum phosphitoxidans DSM 13687]